jgi:hypothetical protein
VAWLLITRFAFQDRPAAYQGFRITYNLSSGDTSCSRLVRYSYSTERGGFTPPNGVPDHTGGCELDCGRRVPESGR